MIIKHSQRRLLLPPLLLGIILSAACVQLAMAFTSNLPICIVNTAGKTIPPKSPDDQPAVPKTPANLKIIFNKDAAGNPIRNDFLDTNYHFNGDVEVWYRGHSSAQFPKKSLGVNLVQSAAIMGMPLGKKFALFAPYADKTLFRNDLAYELANGIASSSGDKGYQKWWAPRTQHCELFLVQDNVNAEYMGVYSFMERIDQQKERVKINKLDKLNTSDPTGGYIWQLNWVGNGNGAFFTTKFSTTYILEYPDGEDVLPAYSNYIASFVSSMEEKLYSVTPDSDPNAVQDVFSLQSFVDYHIFFEFLKNVDTYRYSTYFFKDSGNKPAYIGPHWDYDLAWGNVDFSAASLDPTGWRTGNGNYQLEWVNNLWNNHAVRRRIVERYNQLRRGGALSTRNIQAAIDKYVSYLSEAQERNFNKWQILGIRVWPNPEPVPADYAGEVAALRSWIERRLAWLDENMPQLAPDAAWVPISQCDAALCGAHGDCLLNAAGEPTCFCQKNYYGTSCDKFCDKDTTCSGNGKCNAVTNGNQTDVTCVCDPLFTGPDCSQSTCNPVKDCSGHGKCAGTLSSKGTLYTCICDPEWKGESCNIHNVCDPAASCSGHGTCRVDDDGEVVCTCSGDWTGPSCSEPVLKCSDEVHCSGNGKCSVTGGVVTCDCNPHYTNFNCSSYCEASVTCSGNGFCNTGGNCTCDDGFSGSDCSIYTPPERWDGYASVAGPSMLGGASLSRALLIAFITTLALVTIQSLFTLDGDSRPSIFLAAAATTAPN